jgi:hypothetical protein
VLTGSCNAPAVLQLFSACLPAFAYVLAPKDVQPALAKTLQDLGVSWAGGMHRVVVIVHRLLSFGCVEPALLHFSATGVAWHVCSCLQGAHAHQQFQTMPWYLMQKVLQPQWHPVLRQPALQETAACTFAPTT